MTKFLRSRITRALVTRLRWQQRSAAQRWAAQLTPDEHRHLDARVPQDRDGSPFGWDNAASP